MKTLETRLTVKNQTTVPQEVRGFLKVKSGEKIEWHVVKEIVIVDKSRKMKNPTKFLTSQVKLNIDAVKLVRQIREEFV